MNPHHWVISNQEYDDTFFRCSNPGCTATPNCRRGHPDPAHGGGCAVANGEAPSLLALVREAHDKLDDSIKKFTAEAKGIHGLLQEGMHTFERGDVPAAKELIKLALDKECDLFGDCPCIGDEKLLAAFGFGPDEDTT